MPSDALYQDERSLSVGDSKTSP